MPSNLYEEYLANPDIDIYSKISRIKNHIVGLHHKMDIDFNIARVLYEEGISTGEEKDLADFPSEMIKYVKIHSRPALLKSASEVVDSHHAIMGRFGKKAATKFIAFKNELSVSGGEARTILSWYDIIDEEQFLFNKQARIQELLLPLFEQYCKDTYGSSPLNQFKSLHTSQPGKSSLIKLELQDKIFNEEIKWDDFCEELYTYQMELAVETLLTKNKRSMLNGIDYIPVQFQSPVQNA